MTRIILIFFFLFCSVSSFSQSFATFELNLYDTVFVHSGQNQFLIQNLDVKDLTANQVQIEAVSLNYNLVEIDSVSYQFPNKMAVVWISEKGKTGTAEISVSVINTAGKTEKSISVVVSPYLHHGVNFEIHDAVFWQEVVPLDDTPIFDSIIQNTNLKAAYDNVNWNNINLTVSAGCNAQWCDGHDFSTGFLGGYLVPKISGNYHFYINGDSDYALFLAAGEKTENAVVIAAKSDNHGKIGAEVNGRKSELVALDSGKVYAFYAVQWNVHNENGGVQWELPGTFSRKYIESELIFPEWDTQRPGKVEELKLLSRGDNFLTIGWKKSADNQNIAGYNVYLNGLKVNGLPVSGTSYLIEGLQFKTSYSIVVSAVDKVKNESFVSEVLLAETYHEDNVPPNPPVSLSVDEATGLAIQISWNGASDELTEIIGYNVYLNGELFNKENLIPSNSLVLQVLKPETTYEVQIEAVDAGLNTSVRSEIFEVSTTSFNPADENMGIKTGKIEFSTQAISFNEGLGINTNYINGDVFNAAHTEMLQDLKPGAIRWGALTANPLSFSDYAGAGKTVTIGKFFNRCNNLNAYIVFCCGVENNTDWIKNDETFIRFLEYINGPDESPGGQLRVAEGYTEPFLKNSKGLIFEFGNEVWGANAHNAQIGQNYNNYAEWCRRIARKMRASEYFDSTKIVLVYSARYPSREKSYGLNDKIIVGDSGEVDWIGPSGYLGGNLNYDPAFPPSKSELDYYKNVRIRADEYLTGMYNSHKFEVEQTGRVFTQFMYESNTSTPTYNGRLGQALLSIDYYLTAMEIGSAMPAIFHLTGGQWRITEPENNYRRLPLFLFAKYVNQFCKGDVLYNRYFPNTGSASETGATFQKRPVGIHSYRNENGYTLVLISRDYENDHYLQIDLPADLGDIKNGKIYQFSGTDFNTKTTIVDSINVEIKDGTIVKVPKHAIVFVRFETENMETTNLPLGYFNYPRMEGLSIYAPKNTFTAPNEKLSFRAYITPENSWDKELVWTLINNSGNYSLSTQASYCYVYSGNLVANQTDSLILRVSNRPGNVYDEVVIYLPEVPVNINQNNFHGEFMVYPNPAKNHVNVFSENAQTIKIFSVNGTKVHEFHAREGINCIDVSFLGSGIFTVKTESQTKNVLISK